MSAQQGSEDRNSERERDEERVKQMLQRIVRRPHQWEAAPPQPLLPSSRGVWTSLATVVVVALIYFAGFWVIVGIILPLIAAIFRGLGHIPILGGILKLIGKFFSFIADGVKDLMGDWDNIVKSV